MPSQLPHFIQEHNIFSSDFYLSRKHRSTLALLRNLQFYEVRNKKVLYVINLQDSILNKVHYKLESNLPVVNGTRSQASDILGSSIACPTQPDGGIMIGKYIYQNKEDKKVYIILKCWDAVVIIRRNLEGFALQAEFENVHSFKMHKDTKYQVKLSLSFLNSEPDLITNFQTNHLSSSALAKADTHRKTLDKIKMKQSELLVHKTITKKEFAKLKSTDLFGSNFLRTPRLEEMQILSKCGDAWIKVSADDDVVIGVPLVNNCSTRLTILRNIRAVLQGCSDLNYKFTLYQQTKRFCDLENLQCFFQSKDDYDHNFSWSQCSDFSLRPEGFCVLLLRIKINELLEFDVIQLPLFVFYDIVVSERTFHQKCFITTLSFRDIYTNQSCSLNFHEKHLHRDLLTVIATTYETEARLEYNAYGAGFEDYLGSEMGFSIVKRNERRSEAMNVDDQDEDVSETTGKKVFLFNKNPNSMWHGTLLVITHTSDSSSDVRLYTKTQEKSKVFLRLLEREIMIKCGIKEVHRDTQSLSNILIGFEASLRDECCKCLEMCSNGAMKKDRLDISKKQSLQNELHLNELRTDILFRCLES